MFFKINYKNAPRFWGLALRMLQALVVLKTRKIKPLTIIFVRIMMVSDRGRVAHIYSLLAFECH